QEALASFVAAVRLWNFLDRARRPFFIVTVRARYRPANAAHVTIRARCVAVEESKRYARRRVVELRGLEIRVMTRRTVCLQPAEPRLWTAGVAFVAPHHAVVQPRVELGQREVIEALFAHLR